MVKVWLWAKCLLLRHVDHGLWSCVAGGREVIAVSLHADGLQPVLHCAHSRGHLGTPWLKQGGSGPVIGGEKWRGYFTKSDFSLCLKLLHCMQLFACRWWKPVVQVLFTWSIIISIFDYLRFTSTAATATLRELFHNSQLCFCAVVSKMCDNYKL